MRRSELQAKVTPAKRLLEGQATHGISQVSNSFSKQSILTSVSYLIWEQISLILEQEQSIHFCFSGSAQSDVFGVTCR